MFLLRSLVHYYFCVSFFVVAIAEVDASRQRAFIPCSLHANLFEFIYNLSAFDAKQTNIYISTKEENPAHGNSQIKNFVCALPNLECPILTRFSRVHKNRDFAAGCANEPNKKLNLPSKPNMQ